MTNITHLQLNDTLITKESFTDVLDNFFSIKEKTVYLSSNYNAVLWYKELKNDFLRTKINESLEYSDKIYSFLEIYKKLHINCARMHS